MSSDIFSYSKAIQTNNLIIYAVQAESLARKARFFVFRTCVAYNVKFFAAQILQKLIITITSFIIKFILLSNFVAVNLEIAY